MAWTDLTRLAMKGALDVDYINGVKNNLEHLQDMMEVSHRKSNHDHNIDNAASAKGAYPSALTYVDMSGAPTVSSNDYGDILSVTRVAAGHYRVTMTTGFAGTNDYGSFAVPITTPSEGAPFVSYIAQTIQTSSTVFDVYIHYFDATTSTVSVLAECSFFACAFGKHSFASTWTGIDYMPDMLEGFPATMTEIWNDLIDNIVQLRENWKDGHNGYDGSHKIGGYLPMAAGCLTYKNCIDALDRQEWIVESWTSGVPEGRFTQGTRVFSDGTNDQEARFASMSVGSPFTTPTHYGTLCTMNPYQVATKRARFVHAVQYRDSMLMHPRYYDGSAMSWADTDEANQTGAPDSIAFIRFGYESIGADFIGGDRLAGLINDNEEMADDGYQVSLMLATIVKEELDEFKRLFDAHHNTTDNSHATAPPGIYGVGRVVYDGGSPPWLLQAWSTGVASVAAAGGGVADCTLTLDATFNSFRNVSAIICGDWGSAPGALNYLACQAKRSSATTIDVHLHTDDSAGPPGEPTTALKTFNYIIIGSR